MLHKFSTPHTRSLLHLVTSSKNYHLKEGCGQTFSQHSFYVDPDPALLLIRTRIQVSIKKKQKREQYKMKMKTNKF